MTRVSVNADSLDPATVKSKEIARKFDAANWEDRLDHYEPPDP